MSRKPMPFRRYIRLEFKPQDLWIGGYWDTNGPMVDVWVCLLPMVPVHVRWFRKQKPVPPIDLTDEEWEAWQESLR